MKAFLKRIFGKKKDVEKSTDGINPSEVFRSNNGRLEFRQTFANHGLNDNYLFDFLNYSSGYRGGNSVSVAFAQGSDGMSVEGAQVARPIQVKVKPIDVLNELETIPTPFSLNGLEQKIAILKDKEALINQDYAKREVTGLIERLENRKKYVEFKEFFDNYQNTTDEKIDILLAKYSDSLVMKTSDIFIPEFPDDAIETMKAYTETMEKLCGKKPVFYVIGEAKDFKKAYEKRDPILLVQSPFGFYWQILGAWDKEMILLSEL